MSESIYQNLKYHGQKLVSEAIGDKSLINSLYDNLDILKDDGNFLKKEIISQISYEKKIAFPISNHERFYCSNLDTAQEKLNYLHHRYKFYKANKFHKEYDAPPYLLLEPVSACNLRCPMCFQVDKTFTRKPFMGMMKWELFTRIVDEAEELGVGSITLASRGEPTMHPKYSEMLKYIAKKKNIFELKTNTNATFLTEEICHSLFQSGITTVVISADHYEKEKFEQLRKGSNYEKIVKNVILLNEIRNKFYKDTKTEVRVSGIDLYKDLDRNKFNNFWKPYCDTVSVSYAVERWDTYSNTPHPEINSPCSFLWDRMYIWWDGKCNPCDADYKSHMSYGDVSSSTIKEVWNSDKLKEFRIMHLSQKRKCLNPCDRCGLDFGS